ELAKEWRSDKMLRQLEAMLIVMNRDSLLLVSGTGEVIEPDDGILAIGSGGNYALSAGRALKDYATGLSAKEIAEAALDRKSTRLNSSHVSISYAVFCLKKKKHESDSLIF